MDKILSYNVCEFLIGVDSTIVYSELTGKIQLLNEWFAAALVSTLFFATIPDLIYTYVGYYVFDSRNDPFLLFLPARFVLISKIKEKNKWN